MSKRMQIILGLKASFAWMFPTNDHTPTTASHCLSALHTKLLSYYIIDNQINANRVLIFKENHRDALRALVIDVKDLEAFI